MSRPRPTAGDRVVQAAIRRIHDRGISVGLDGSALRTRSPPRGVTSDGLPALAKPGRLPSCRPRADRARDAPRARRAKIGAIREFVKDRREDAATEPGRRTIVVESLRIAVDADFKAPPPVRTDYLALRATCTSLPEGENGKTVTSEIASAERRFVMHRASVYSRLPEAHGLQTQPPDRSARLRGHGRSDGRPDDRPGRARLRRPERGSVPRERSAPRSRPSGRARPTRWSPRSCPSSSRIRRSSGPPTAS